jgi:hypothetical protein
MGGDLKPRLRQCGPHRTSHIRALSLHRPEEWRPREDRARRKTLLTQNMVVQCERGTMSVNTAHFT